MSTKIYNGYYSNLCITDLLEKFKALVPEFNQLKLHGYTAYLVSETIQEIDRRQRNGEPLLPASEYLYKNYEKHEQKIRETVSKGLREPDLDFHATCSVFPITAEYRTANKACPDNLETLILFYCDDCKEMIDLWRGQDFIFEYYYQDQTDRPKKISKKRWEQRIKDWDHVLGNDVSMYKGYSFTFCIERLPWYRTVWKLSNYNLLTKERRANILLRDRFVGEEMKRIKGEGEFEMSDYFKALDSWAAYKEGEDYRKKINEIIPTLLEIDFEPPGEQ